MVVELDPVYVDLAVRNHQLRSADRGEVDRDRDLAKWAWVFTRSGG
jgi:hypothetical protein